MIPKEKLHKITVVDKDTPLKQISDIVWNAKPDALLVRDGENIVGIMTDSDVVMKVGKEDMYSEDITVKEIMSSPVITIDADKEMSDAVELMAGNNIMKLPVIKDGQPLGILYAEEVLAMDYEKWKKILTNLVIEAVYKMLIKDNKVDITVCFSNVRGIAKFSNMESQIEFDLYVYQQGLVLVAYNFIRENFNLPVAEIKKAIKDNYSELLNKYCRIGE